MRARVVIGLMAVSLFLLVERSPLAGADPLLRLVEGLALDRPAQPFVAPSFVLSALDGRAVSLADVRGRVVLLYFWTTW